MLAKVPLWLLDHNYHVSIIARNRQKMGSLLRKVSDQSRVTPMLVDYMKDEALKKEIEKQILKAGPVDLVVAWIHSDAGHALPVVSDVISRSSRHWELYHVLGSSQNLDQILREFPVKENCSYHQIQLGFVMKNNHSRWLTHEEISNGVIEAIREQKKRHIVGQIEPWDKRP